MMTTQVLPRASHSQPSALGNISLSVSIALMVWFLLVVSLGWMGAFVGPARTPPIAIAAGVGVPLVVFFALLRFSTSFRDFVLSLDLRLVVGMQAWRWAGLGFIFLYAYHVLPPMFALPAGLGDMAVGFTAPRMILALIRDPDFVASARFLRWNVLGIIDLVVALSLGTLGATIATGAPGEISTAPLATLPLLIVPVFLVPLFLMLHVTALMQHRPIGR
jgi:hypothetical protein